EGYTYEDISEQLNTTYKAVDGALQRARKKLLSTKE
ncbi:MAG: sigma-70 region 4 domain-containing protein, partial [Clostridia bacterium]|nr:sigma-70 region 4 domain-containing protein [Clostridia bacterium]